MTALRKSRLSRGIKAEDLAKLLDISTDRYYYKERNPSKMYLFEARIIANFMQDSIENIFYKE
jgi:DNA-binding XRE family transcriptional regulator